MTIASDRPHRWIVSGRVQGVGFRWFVLRRAEPLGVHGWVRNLSDGRVEIVAAGPAAAISALDAAVRSGPRFGRVDGVESTEYPHEVDIPNAFEIR